MKSNNEEVKQKREGFIKDYCKEKGWNPDELSTEQYLLITRQDQYINPNKK